MNVLAIVPARGGSKGIPGKNLAMCGGKPLIEWTAEACIWSNLITTMVVSTDEPAISRCAIDAFDQRWAVHINESIGDDAQIETRLDKPINDHQPDIIVLLQPTSPVRTGKQIDEAIEQLQREGADSLVSVVESHSFLWHPGPPVTKVYTGRPRRQDFIQYEENGSIYVFTRDHWERTHNRLGGKISLFVMPDECAVQVDTPFDLWMADQILERQHALV
jgi:CMP-N,N'-diacetyllegionaminic acid synthase